MTSAKKTSSSPMKKKSLSQGYSTPQKKQSASPKKAKKSNSSKRTAKSSKHPGYQQMVTESLQALNVRGGSSRAKIMNHIKTTYGIESGKSANSFLRSALKSLLEDSVISLSKGTGLNNGYYSMASKGKKRSSSPKKTQRKSASSSQNQTDDGQKKVIFLTFTIKIWKTESNGWPQT